MAEKKMKEKPYKDDAEASTSSSEQNPRVILHECFL